MKKQAFPIRLVPLLGLLCAACPAWGQDEAAPATAGAPHVVKSSVNADSDNAEFCLEFDRPPAPLPRAKLASSLKLEADGAAITPQNIDLAASSLCLFPLDRDKSYRLSLGGLRGAGDEKLSAPYNLSFTIPDRSPSLAFTGRNGSASGFLSYADPLTLRAVNVAHARLAVYRVSDPAAMARAWQDRGQVSLAPSESAYLARTKGQQVWESDEAFDAAPNMTQERKLALPELVANLAPGLYLIVAEANTGTERDNGAAEKDDKQAAKGLTPLAAAWFTKSDFSLRALRDEDGIHVFAAASGGAKAGLHLMAMSRKPEQLAEAQGNDSGVDLIGWPQDVDKDDIVGVIGIDGAGNPGFADIAALPPLANLPALGAIRMADLFAVPGDAVNLAFSLTAPENAPGNAPGSLHLARGASGYADLAVPPLVKGEASLSFPAPAPQGAWSMRWRKDEGAVLADAPLRVTANADLPRLELAADRDAVAGDAPLAVTVKSVANTGKPAALIGGQVTAWWQKLDPATMGWKDYQFGVPATMADMPVQTADFLTDPLGIAQLRLTPPPRPAEPGLYQIAVAATADADAGVADAPVLTLPLRPEATVIGIKPLAAHARFAQNGIARFALIGIGGDGRPRDVAGLSYQLYEEGRSFAWYQDEGRWKYKPEPQLRPIGGGAAAIKADGGGILEIPVTAGNYRLEILDGTGKRLAQTAFSADWDSSMAGNDETAASLPLSLPKIIEPGATATVHVALPQPAMLTVIVADTHIRKVLHEMRPKGDTAIAFTPGPDWQSGVGVTVEAAPQDGGAPLHAHAEAAIAKPPAAGPANAGAGVAIVAPDAPENLLLRKDGQATLTFGVENRDDQPETYHYVFTAAAGLRIDNGDKGDITLGPRQSRSLTLAVSGGETGVRELKLELAGTRTPRAQSIWQIAVLPKDNALRSLATVTVPPQQPLLAPAARPHGPNEASTAFIGRRPSDGLPEILAYAFTLHPFTTRELALGVEALRLWGPVLASSGMAPGNLIEARRRQWLEQLLRRQNPDGGFAALRGGDSTMEDTAAALTALGPDKSALAAPGKALAIGWIGQRLSNTWFDEKERAPRAAAYAALAAADAIDPASLHYFSDTGAQDELPAEAEADIAAAFKHIGDPNAAAFWIKKMLDANPGPKSVQLLGALAATDALSSDDAHQALQAMTDMLGRNAAPAQADVFALLRAVAADNADAGDWRLGTGGGHSQGMTGVMAARLTDAGAAGYRNANNQPLFVTYAAETDRAPSQQPDGAAVARHIYRLNGVELSPQAKPGRNETYIVEIKGTAPPLGDGEQALLHEGSASSLRPIGCPVSPRVEVPAFIPWFTPQELTPVKNCEMLPHELNAVLVRAPDDGHGGEKKADAARAFRLVYFAHIDTASVADLAPPRLRVLK